MQQDLPGEMMEVLHDHPQVRFLEVLLADINGIIRGKRISLDEVPSLFGRGLNFSASAHLLDSRGRNIEGLGLGTDDGDPDYLCGPVPGSLTFVPWAAGPLAQCLISMHTRDGRPYFAESRNVLAAVAERFKAQGLKTVVAIEMEFYLLADRGDALPELKVGRIPGTSTIHTGPQLYNVEDLHDLDPFLQELHAACLTQRLPASAVVSECAPGQFEVNLHHVADPLLACDHAVLLRRAIRGVARRHGLAATFMAKPFAEFAGSGTHVHVSVYDAGGGNIFAGAQPGSFSPALHHAVGGLLAAMPESMAILAPNANSYRRLRPGAFAPITPNWGVNHRNVAIRVPLSEPADTRLEHRVAGADANPYLVTAAVLAGMHAGIERRIAAPPMVREGEPIERRMGLPDRWDAALDAFAAGSILPGYLGAEFCRVFEYCRRWESDQFNAQVGHLDYEWYLRTL